VSQFRATVDRQYEAGAALNVAMQFEIDDVIDPAESRSWISTLLTAGPLVRVRGRSGRTSTPG